ISAGKEVDIWLDGGWDKPLRLVDMLLYSWDKRLDVCVDLTGSSPLSQTGMVDFLSDRAVVEEAKDGSKGSLEWAKKKPKAKPHPLSTTYINESCFAKFNAKPETKVDIMTLSHVMHHIYKDNDPKALITALGDLVRLHKQVWCVDYFIGADERVRLSSCCWNTWKCSSLVCLFFNAAPGDWNIEAMVKSSQYSSENRVLWQKVKPVHHIGLNELHLNEMVLKEVHLVQDKAIKIRIATYSDSFDPS
ncbi:hypothetical protein Tco_1226118, partial [Tanacetum coccineum]